MPQDMARPRAESRARDDLALERTQLANERTVLAYVRTALTLLVGGLTLIQFFQSPAVQVLGWIFIPLAVVAAVLGVCSYTRMARHVVRARDDQPAPPS